MRTTTRWSVIRAAAAALAGASGAAGGVGLVALAQARLAAGRPGEGTVGYTIDGVVQRSPAQQRRVVWLGDSLAAGLGAIAREVSLPHLVASHADATTRLHVYATPGATGARVVQSQLPALAQLRDGLAEIGDRIDAIGVSVGANDIAALTSRRRLRRQLDAIVDATDGTPVVFLSIPQIGDALRLPHPLRTIARLRGAWLNRELRAVAARHPSVEYASVRRRPEWIRRHHRPHFLSADRFHPSGAGYAVWADGVAAAFDRVLTPKPVADPATLA